MSQAYLRRQTSANQRTSTIAYLVIRAHQEVDDENRASASTDVSHQLATISQLCLPSGREYQPQRRVPPIGPEAQLPFILTTVEDDGSSGEQKPFSVTTQVDQSTDDETDDQDKEETLNKTTKRMLFLVEPVLSGLILFPIIALFWYCGWNLGLILSNYLNNFPLDFNIDDAMPIDYGPYSWQSLLYAYLIVQCLLLLCYLCQNLIYDFLEKRRWIIKSVLLQLHIFVLATIYIAQWKILWSVWTQSTPHEWHFEITFSVAALFATIVFNGHLSGLICSPFLLSYDSIEYCIHFGCSLLTREMKQWKINLINYVLWEIIGINLSVTSWIGFYHYLDDYLYPDNSIMSAGICLTIGYLLYFPLMYFQAYLENLNLKYEFWTFISINFPQFYRNLRHLLAFLSCLFVWRGYWLLYAKYIYIFNDYYKTYLLIYPVSFLVLSILQTSSSVNGPLSDIKEKNNFFPLYPHCYVSIVQRKFSHFSY